MPLGAVPEASKTMVTLVALLLYGTERVAASMVAAKEVADSVET
jgi:hypothetical protein